MKRQSTSSNKFTTKYSILPLGPGVPSPSLTGFDFAPIESRKPVEKALKAFITLCRRDATSLNVKIIKAEWGEGKTDAYERYICPQIEKKGDACYFVSTSTVIDKIKRFDSIFPTTKYVISSKFLASLFVAIVDEAFSHGVNISTFANPSAYQNDPLGFIEESLKNHAEKGLEKIFVFIDEFEELLNYETDVQRQIISGIKELINGQLGLIHERGTYEGMVHFFIACTPYAYNRIMDSIELGQVAGSVKSRFSTTALPEVSKREALQFLVDLTRFSYNGQLPDVFPFRTSGPLNGIYAISHGNLREMIKLFVKLLSTAVDEESKQLRVVDFNHFLESLRDEDISIYGAAGKAIDNELLDRVMANMNTWKRGEECKKVLNLLIGELKPFSIDEIGKRLGIPPYDVHELVSMTNGELKKMGIGKTITAFMPVSADKTFETVKNRLNVVQNQVVIGETRIPLQKFEESLTFYEVEKDDTLVSFSVLPKESADLQLMFEELTDDDAENLRRSISDLFDPLGATRHYLLSQEFANQIFPSPLWLLMDFVKDRSKRMDLWRKASKEFVESAKEFREGTLRLIEHVKLGKFESLPARGPKHYRFLFNVSPDKQVEIITYVHTSTGNVTIQDINEISKDVRAVRPNLILLIYAGEIEGVLPATLDGIENAFLQLHFRKLRALQLMVAQFAKQEGISVDERILDARLRDISDEAEVRERLAECYNKCKSAGIVVDDLSTYYAESGAMIAGILKYYINFLGSRKTSTDIFLGYEQTLKKIKFFGDKEVPFAPVDIESTGEFVRYENELIRNGFLTRTSDLTIKVEETPVEKRFMAIMKKHPKMPLSQMKQFFINAAQAENILERVYIPILEHKGLIETEGEEILAVDPRQRKTLLDQSFANHNIGLKSKQAQWQSFAKICVSKGGKEERDVAIIDFDFFEQLIKKTMTEIEEEREENLISQKIHLATLLLNYYHQRLEPKVDSAFKASWDLKKKCHGDVEKVKTALDKVLGSYDSYCIGKKYMTDEVEELAKLLEIQAKFDDKTFDASFPLEELRKIYEEFDWNEFHFRARDPAEAHFFNLKYAKLEKIYSELSSSGGMLVQACEAIEKLVSSTEDLKKQIQRELARYSIPTEYTVSSKIMDFLQKYQSKPMQAQSALPKIKINVVKEFFMSLEKQLSRDQARVQRILEKVDAVKKSEKSFLESTLEKRFETAKSFFIGHYAEEFKSIQDALKSASDNYASVTILVTGPTTMSLDDLYNIADSAEKRFKELIDARLAEAEENLKSVFEDVKTKLSAARTEMKEFLNILQKGLGERVSTLCEKYMQEFDVEITITQGAVKTVREEEKTIYTWVDRLKQLNAIRDKLFKDLGPILPSEQGAVLLEAVRILQEKDTEWIDLPILISELKNRLGQDEDKVALLLKELAKVNLLKEGASLPI